MIVLSDAIESDPDEHISDVEELFRKYLLPFKKDMEQNFNKLRADLTQFSEENKVLRKKIVHLEEKVNKIENNFNTNTDSSSSDSIIGEFNDRKKRESNVIAYNVPWVDCLLP